MTNRRFDLSTPIPKAFVATITSPRPDMNASCAADLSPSAIPAWYAIAVRSRLRRWPVIASTLRRVAA
jgi:hypothetical protein